MDTKLILLEGFPGAGKSTTTARLGKAIQQHGIACRWYLEDDNPHPIDCLDFSIKGLPDKMIPLWAEFARQTLQEPTITIIESRLWQNTAFFMYMSNIEVDEIRQFNMQLGETLAPLSPVLLYLDQVDTEIALRRLYTDRREEWMKWALEVTTPYPWFQSRGLTDFMGWIQFFREWGSVAEKLYKDWPHRKLKINDPHADWERAYRQMDSFLQIGESAPGDV
jgi:hypothetical protein